EVRYLILCDDIVADPINPHKLIFTGLLSHIRSAFVPPFPIIHREFSALIVLTNCSGEQDIFLRIVENVTGQVTYRTRLESSGLLALNRTLEASDFACCIAGFRDEDHSACVREL